MGGAITAAQRAAVAHVRILAAAERDDAVRRVTAVLGADVDVPALARAVASRPVALNFHPDRLAADGRLVAEALADGGVYRSQFETRISNGSLSAVPGGDRDRWEEQLFGGAYHSPPAPPADRPRYGGLDLHGHTDGPCPRFGSCHLRLGAHVNERATFCFGDSHVGPVDVGTADAFEPVLAALVEAGWRADSPPAPGHGRRLDDYVEAQVHGAVRLADDAVALVADPSFRSTPVGALLEATADRHGLDLSWHPGFVLDAAEVPADFRGPAVAALAARLGGTLDAARIGEAARAIVRSPGEWPDGSLQHVKQLWHVLVRYGRPAVTPA